MKKPILLFVFGCLSLIAACAQLSAEKFNEEMNAMIGKTEAELIVKGGAPDGVYESDGVKYLVYEQSRTRPGRRTAPSYWTSVYGNTAYSTPFGGGSVGPRTTSCKVTFTLKKGVVTAWHSRGDMCVM